MTLRLPAFLPLAVLLGMTATAFGADPAVGLLQGTIHKNQGTETAGQVADAATGQPLGGVNIRVPELGYRAVTGADGRYALPEPAAKPTVVIFEKEGYVPATATLDATRPLPLRASLRKIGSTLVLDAEIRHLGDGSYSPVSAGAANFSREPHGPALVRRFSLKQPADRPAILEIGSVIGLDTAAAHTHGQSVFRHSSTPMQIRLNGVVIGVIALNGDRHRIAVPPELLAPVNTLEIVTGYKIAETGPVDYDDMELALLTLNF